MQGAHTPAMDVFSLGIVLFIMLVGRKPFNIQQCEDLSYCQLALADAPGLQDPRCALRLCTGFVYFACCRDFVCSLRLKGTACWT